MLKRWLLFVMAFGVVAMTLNACSGATPAEQARELHWEVLEPNDGSAAGPPGEIWTLGLRAPDYKDGRFSLITRVTAPDGASHESRADVTAATWTEFRYPIDFAGANNDLVGSYTVVFEVNGVQVGRDSFETIPPVPSNEALEFDVPQPLVSSTGAASFEARLRNTSDYYPATNIVVHLRLSDEYHDEIATLDVPLGDLQPGDSTVAEIGTVPGDVYWEFYKSSIDWDWGNSIDLSRATSS